ncbi:hypothetical protein BDN70DRAFT_922007 [Pholiota conissans]|uniref:Uncharacterized protein n=1 Tax=Pholiota conissans TaxID=109636 RepID=A0A9P5YZC7_9AGAR|nr:hypothetical protein BDN70DRAFT_922007 [Pholiota conissans]
MPTSTSISLDATDVQRRRIGMKVSVCVSSVHAYFRGSRSNGGIGRDKVKCPKLFGRQALLLFKLGLQVIILCSHQPKKATYGRIWVHRARDEIMTLEPKDGAKSLLEVGHLQTWIEQDVQDVLQGREGRGKVICEVPNVRQHDAGFIIKLITSGDAEALVFGAAWLDHVNSFFDVVELNHNFTFCITEWKRRWVMTSLLSFIEFDEDGARWDKSESRQSHFPVCTACAESKASGKW